MRRLVPALATVVLVATVGIACLAEVPDEAVSTGPPEAATDVPPSRRSTAVAVGGGIVADIDATKVPAFSDIAVEAEVLTVHGARVDTVDGAMPSVDPELGPHQWNFVYPVTDVTLRVAEVLGRRGNSASKSPGIASIAAGAELVIMMHGGAVTVTVSPEDARVLGITESMPDASGNDGPPRYPDGPLEITLSVQTDVILAEGERVILFLREETKPGLPPRMNVVGGQAGVYRLPGWPSTLDPFKARAASLNAAIGPREENLDDLQRGG